MFLLPFGHVQLNHSSKEMQMHQKNITTQVAALKNELDQSVRAAGAKTRELDKINMETKRSVADQNKQLAKLTVKMKAADDMVDAVKESTRKVKAQEQKAMSMEDTLRSVKEELKTVGELRKLADETRADTDDLMPRVQAVEASSLGLMEKAAAGQERTEAALEKIDQLNAELEREQEERLRVENEHSAAMDGLRNDLALLVNALGGRSQLDLEAFCSIQPSSNSRGALDVTDARIKRLTDAQSKLAKEFQRVEDLEVRHDVTSKELQTAQAQLKTMSEVESELSLKLSSYDRWKQKLETKFDELGTMTRAAAEAAEAATAALAAGQQTDAVQSQPPQVLGSTAASSPSSARGPAASAEVAAPAAQEAGAAEAPPTTTRHRPPEPAPPKKALEEMEAHLRKSIEELRADLGSALEDMEILKSQMEKVHALGVTSGSNCGEVGQSHGGLERGNDVGRADLHAGEERDGGGKDGGNAQQGQNDQDQRQEGGGGGGEGEGAVAGTGADGEARARGGGEGGGNSNKNRGGEALEAPQACGAQLPQQVGHDSASRGSDGAEVAADEGRSGSNGKGDCGQEHRQEANVDAHAGTEAATSKTRSKLGIPERPEGATRSTVSQEQGKYPWASQRSVLDHAFLDEPSPLHTRTTSL